MNNTSQPTEKQKDDETIEPTLPETKIDFNLRTGLKHRDKYEEAETQIVYTSYYIGSIFWFIRVALEAESLLEQQTETTAFSYMQLKENVQFMIQVAEGLAEWLPDYARTLAESPSVERGRAKPSPNPIFKTKSDDSVEDLARQISDIMHNPHLPKSIKNALQDNLNTVYTNIHTPENVLANLKEIKQFVEVKDAEEN